MKFYTATIKALTILLGVLVFNSAWAGDDEFSVKVTEKVSGPIKETELCLESREEQRVYQVPSFSTDQTGLASPTFHVDFEFDDILPPIGTQFEVRALVFIKDAQNNYQALTPSNATTGTIYTTGSSGTLLNGTITLSVNPEFYVLSNCEYYFRFWLADITPQTPGPVLGSGNEGNNTTSLTSPHSMISPLLRLTNGCVRYTAGLCSIEVGMPSIPTHRIGLSEGISSLKVFPNPATNGPILIKLDSKNSTTDQEVNIQLLNMQGQVLRERSQNVKSGSDGIQIKMNLAGIPSGIYLIRATENKVSLFDKLIIN